MSSALPPLCIFHKNCMDGRASAAVVKRFEPECVCVPQQYGSKRPSVLGRKVYIVDFGFQIEEMKKIEREASEVIWIDHHITHQQTQIELGWGHFALEESGASLTWKVLFPNEEMPEIIKYIRDRDLWLWEMEDSRAINAALFFNTTDQQFEDLLNIDLQHMKELGTPLLAAQELRIAQALRNGIPSQNPYGLMGKRALVMNTNVDISELGERAYLPKNQGGAGYDLAIIFSMRRDGKWVHSLRSNKDVDCERIARNRGGGGHTGAASYMQPLAFHLSEDCLDWPFSQ